MKCVTLTCENCGLNTQLTERDVKKVKLLDIGEGTSEIMRLVIARNL